MATVVSSLAPVQINSTVLAVERIGFSTGIISDLSQHSGQLYATLHKVSGAVPRITFTTPFLAAYNLLGLTVVNASTLDVYLTKFGALVPTAGSTHPRFALSSSCTAACHITGASVNQDGDLMAEVECFPLSVAGVAHPITYSTTNALITLAGQPVLHTLGPCSLNGTVVGGLQSSAVDLGQQLNIERTDGALYPIVGARVGAQPKITNGHADPFTLFSTLGLLGLNLTSNFVQYFRQYSATTGVIDTGATAISFTIASGRAEPGDMSAQQGGVATLGFMVSGLSSSSTHPIAVSTSATAPTIP